MEKLLQKKEYLKTIFGNHTSSEDGKYLLQKLFGEANSKINIPRFRSTYGKANNQTSYKTETRIYNKKRYEAYQIKYLGNNKFSAYYNLWFFLFCPS